MSIGQYRVILQKHLENNGTKAIKKMTEEKLPLDEYRYQQGLVAGMRDAIALLETAHNELYGIAPTPDTNTNEELYG